MALWIELGYSVESTGAAGFLSEKDEFVFKSYGIDTPLALLTLAGFLKKVPGGWECKMFIHYNAQLDASWIPGDSDESWQLFLNGRAKMAEQSSEILAALPSQSWFSMTGKIEEGVMKKIVLLVKIIDAILKVGKRPPAEFEPPLIHAGLAIITEWPETKINVILRRAFEVSRRKNLPPGFTRSTIVFLEKFDDIVTLLKIGRAHV